MLGYFAITVNEKGSFKELPFLLLYGKNGYLYHELQLFKEENPMGFHFISFTTVVFGLCRTKYAYAPESNGFSSKSPSHVLGYFVITVNEKEDF